MATHKSSEKRHRQSLKRQTLNRRWKSRIRTVSKEVTSAALQKDKLKAAEALKAAMKEIGKAKTKGVIPANTASRKVARLSRLVTHL